MQEFEYVSFVVRAFVCVSEREREPRFAMIVHREEERDFCDCALVRLS